MPYIIDPDTGKSWKLNNTRIRREISRGKIIPLEEFVKVPPKIANQIFVRQCEGAREFAHAWWQEHGRAK